MFLSSLSLLAAACLVRLCAAQASGWQEGQVNATMCYWQTPRAAVIRDTAYIDGGYLWWMPGLSDGIYGNVVSDGNPLGLVYLLNFSTPFKTSDNISSVLTTVSKASGSGNANNIGPNYVDGGMFANYYRWFTYGGLLALTDAFKAQDANQVAAYNAYPNELPGQQFAAGYDLEKLPDTVSRYISGGAAASAPSENLGFYFGGLRAPNFGPIFQFPGNATLNANVSSETLIQLNMTSEQQNTEVWSNTTLTIPGRASAEIVWVPVSDKGILVAIGGATYPYYASLSQKNNDSINILSNQQSVKFLSTVSVYDISANKWYEQATSDAPTSPLAQGCTVVASSADGLTHNIYWYGGFDGVHPTEDFSDDVWVLSIPSFTWVKVYSGKASHARAGHRCFQPYPDQMIVIGGYSALTGAVPECVEDGIIQIFNLSSATWIDHYNPNTWNNYSVPSAVYAAVGTSTSPAAGFVSGLSTVMGTKYDTTKVIKFYPYTISAVKNTTSSVLPSATVRPSSKTPSYLAPVLAVVLGLFVITLIILGVLLWRRRKYLQRVRNGTQSESGTADSRFWVGQWLRGTPNANDVKAPTVTTDQTEETYPSSPYDYEDRPKAQEFGDTQIHELMDTSIAQEMDSTGTGFVPLTPKPKRGPSTTSSVVSSNSSFHRPPISPIGRPGSPSLGADSNPRVTSGVSDISDTKRGHLRGISDTSISTQGGAGARSIVGGGNSAYATPTEKMQMRDPPAAAVSGSGSARPDVMRPMTPPDMSNTTGDYFGARSTGNPTPKRRSNFEERLDEDE